MDRTRRPFLIKEGTTLKKIFGDMLSGNDVSGAACRHTFSTFNLLLCHCHLVDNEKQNNNNNNNLVFTFSLAIATS